MYGTVARIHAKPGMKAQLVQNFREQTRRKTPGFVASYLYQLDSNSDEYFLAAVFQDKKTYLANADSPEQDELYRKLMALLAGEPEWHDGEIVAYIDTKAAA